MTIGMNRRDLLRTGIAGGLCLATPGLGALAASAQISHAELRGGAAVFSAGGSNVVVVPGPDGLILVDTGPMGQGKALLEAINGFSGGAPVRTAFNTHWHYDQTGGNEAVRASGAEIMSHENTKLWLGGDFYVEWQDKRYMPRPEKAIPTKSFYKGGEMTAGDETIVYDLLFQAHTDGDIYVHFRNRNILAVGGLLAAEGYPILDYSTGGWIGGMLEANAALLEIADEETLIVSESGAVQRKADLQAQHDMLEVLYERMKEMARKGFAAEEMLEAGVTKEYDEVRGDPTFFVTNAYYGMTNHTYDMGGFI